jgi:acyl carrier protein
MHIQTLITLLEDATQNLPGSVTAQTSLAALEGWDSMGLVAFVQLVCEQVNIELDAEALGTCRTVTELFTMVTDKLTA